jgi:uncharacterized protein YbbC (DUF1343 family)
MANILYGIDKLLIVKSHPLKKGHWGLVTNEAAQTGHNIPNRIALLNSGWNLTCLFSPEHGISASAPDGHSQPNQTDQLTKLPIYSLYGPRFGPALDELENVDGIIFDLPDVGIRFYTYISTLSYVMEACLKAKKPLVVLDRPNPLSGQLDLAEGPMLDEKNLSSFIGRWNIPIRHSLTMGELALFWQQEKNMQQLDLTTIPCEGWQFWQYFTDTGLNFVPPSPAINHPETLLTYPALCFMEGVNVNEGRGTAFPFQQFGAPWLDGKHLSGTLNNFDFPGVTFEPCFFRPATSRYVGEDCQGVKLIIKNRSIYRPVQTGIGILALLKLNYTNDIQWANYPTHANPSGKYHLDLLLGQTDIRPLLDQTPEAVLRKCSEFTRAPSWKSKVEPFLLYPND